jgi:hypothetical protein
VKGRDGVPRHIALRRALADDIEQERRRFSPRLTIEDDVEEYVRVQEQDYGNGCCGLLAHSARHDSTGGSSRC